jgi:hypothetical protein
VRASKSDCEQGKDCECKAPLTVHGYQDAETSRGVIARWWARHPDANIGLATGAPGPDVLDVDVTNGKPGPRSLNQVIRAGLAPPPMAIVRTWSGGQHLYYLGSDQHNSSLAKQGLDFRSSGGYVIAPPSAVHGRPYLLDAHGREPASIDFGKIREHFQPQAQRPARQARDGQRSTGHLAGFVASLEEGNRNNGTFWAACRAVEAGDEGALPAIASAAVGTGLDQRAVDKTIASALRTARPKAPEREAAG